MSLKGQVVLGLKWTTLSTLVVAAVAVIKISVLARFLEKSDFGLMALISFVIGFMNLFSDMGLSTAILHKQDISKKTYASLFWFNLVFSVVLYLTLLVCSPFIAEFYKNPELGHLISILGINLVLSGIGIQFKTIEIKNLLFKNIGIIEIVAALISLVVAIYLAMNSYGVLSLVYSALVQYVITNLLYFGIGLKKYGLLFYFNFPETIPFLKIGSYQVGGQVANYFNRDLDILIIGKFFSPELLGGYSLAKQLVFRPAQVINPILVKVASPTLAKFQDNIVALKNNYLRLIRIVSMINIPVYLIIIIFAPFVVQLFYGAGFDNIVSIVRILSIYMIFRALGNPIGSLVIATGRTDMEFKWNIMNLLIMPVFIYVGSSFGINGVAVALTMVMAVLFVPSWKYLVYEMTNASLKEYVKAICTFNWNDLKR